MTIYPANKIFWACNERGLDEEQIMNSPDVKDAYGLI